MMTTPYARPIPNVNDPEMREFWKNTLEHRLTAQLCQNCGTLRFPALPICDTCLDERSEWVDVAQHGTVWSFVVYHRAFHPGFEHDIPYAVAVVETDDGVRYVGRIVGDRDGLAVGSAVVAEFDDATSEFTMVNWRVA
jgi:uncharacterized OB-fold protein